ncbi:GFA family protein [Inquilinus limosus]|uniref:Aldehyde-activating protein n=1 Tax=Inquilinus limosus TaxID=171674 RepID=A0A211ZQD1_9PROT|nr:GFA family protein [Inquilinus limosus]OWJ67491.1 aldehyde-activating protein [Inquilinus limosus]
MARTASCACGGLRVTCAAEPILVVQCHCLACQRRTGSPFGVAALFRREDVRAEGPDRCYERPSDSGVPVLFHFCPNCGSTVFREPRRKPDAVAVAVGTFADPGFPAPDQAIHGQHRHPWVGEPG